MSGSVDHGSSQDKSWQRRNVHGLHWHWESVWLCPMETSIWTTEKNGNIRKISQGADVILQGGRQYVHRIWWAPKQGRSNRKRSYVRLIAWSPMLQPILWHRHQAIKQEPNAWQMRTSPGRTDSHTCLRWRPSDNVKRSGAPGRYVEEN